MNIKKMKVFVNIQLIDDSRKKCKGKKVSPKESFIQKIKNLNEDIINKVNKFNQELKK